MDRTLETTPQPGTVYQQPDFKQTLQHFWAYIKSPQYIAEPSPPPAQVWRPFLQLSILKIVVALSVGGAAFGLLALLGYDDPSERHEVEALIKRLSPAVVLLLLSVVGPFIEEAMFRYPLRYTGIRLFVVLMLLSIFCLPLLMGKLGVSSLLAIVLTLIAVINAIAFYLSQRRRQQVQNLWEQHFGIVFYSVAVVFAFIHLLNYKALDVPILLLPLLVLPQLVGGIFWGYFRMNYSFWWAFAGHGLYNAVACTIALLMR